MYTKTHLLLCTNLEDTCNKHLVDEGKRSLNMFLLGAKGKCRMRVDCPSPCGVWNWRLALPPARGACGGEVVGKRCICACQPPERVVYTSAIFVSIYGSIRLNLYLYYNSKNESPKRPSFSVVMIYSYYLFWSFFQESGNVRGPCKSGGNF